MEQTNSLIIDAITEIANSDKLIKQVEPNIMYPRKVNKAEVIRVLKSYLLFAEQLEKNDSD